MPNTRVLLGAAMLWSLLFVAGCRQPSVGDRAAAVRALREVELAEEQTWISKDLDKAVNFYADDAVVMNPNAPALKGKDRIRASMKPEFEDAASTGQYQITDVEVAQSGELGYTAGTYAFTSIDPATRKPIEDRGKWLTIRKKQPDGSWRIIMDTASSDLPLSAPGK
jgi:uncharacterized protein (TIGR02246 family)